MVRYQVRTSITAEGTALSEHIGGDQFLQHVGAFLKPNPLLDLFNTKVGWSVEGKKRYASSGVACGVGLCEALTLPDHAVFQTADVEDALPRSIALLFKLD